MRKRPGALVASSGGLGFPCRVETVVAVTLSAEFGAFVYHILHRAANLDSDALQQSP
jgi:hypothetical protein